MELWAAMLAQRGRLRLSFWEGRYRAAYDAHKIQVVKNNTLKINCELCPSYIGVRNHFPNEPMVFHSFVCRCGALIACADDVNGLAQYVNSPSYLGFDDTNFQAVDEYR
jgi:hypothetical protein